MKIVIVGSTALDSIKTPHHSNPRLLGGSASHAAVAASFFSPVSLIGVVGDDFPKKYLQLFKKHGIDLTGLQSQPGKTFHWSGEYELNMNNRKTLSTELGVFETFSPHLPDPHRDAPFVLLANIAPSLQIHVLDQVRKPKFVVADTMDLWLNIALPELLRLLKRIDCFVLNDSESRQLTDESNPIRAFKKLHKLGPRYVIIKKGEHGSILSGPDGLFVLPAFPLLKLQDPTGAGDSFIGGLLGFLASQSGDPRKHLRKAMAYGTVVASFWCEGFGLTRAVGLNRAAIEERFSEFNNFTRLSNPK